MHVTELLLIAVGLSMDAFAVSVCKGLSVRELRPRHLLLAGLYFGGFQFLMPVAGWFCVHTIVEYFRIFERAIPWIALGLLLFIGGGMLREGLAESAASHDDAAGESLQTAGEHGVLTPTALFLQGIATSIDALSVGFTIADYSPLRAFLCALIIAAVTFVICLFGIRLGKIFGTRLSGKASILGGIILIAIGLEIFLTGTVLK